MRNEKRGNGNEVGSGRQNEPLQIQGSLVRTQTLDFFVGGSGYETR